MQIIGRHLEGPAISNAALFAQRAIAWSTHYPPAAAGAGKR
jgi:hypothetical protein